MGTPGLSEPKIKEIHSTTLRLLNALLKHGYGYVKIKIDQRKNKPDNYELHKDY